MTRSPAATPVWIASSTRPDTVATCCGHDVVAAVGLTLDGVRLALEAALAATDQALGAGARLAGLRLATALEAAQGDPAAARERLGDVGGDAGDAVTRLQHGADVDQPGALGDVAALLRRRLGGGGVGLGGLARLVLRGAARATTGGLRRRLGGRRARGVARGVRVLRLRVAAAFLAAALRFAADVLCGGGAGGGGHVVSAPLSLLPRVTILVLSPLGRSVPSEHMFVNPCGTLLHAGDEVAAQSQNPLATS